MAERRQVAAVDADRAAVDRAAAAHVAEQRHARRSSCPSPTRRRARAPRPGRSRARSRRRRRCRSRSARCCRPSTSTDAGRAVASAALMTCLPGPGRWRLARRRRSRGWCRPSAGRWPARAGTPTTAGRVIARRFSLIIRPQSAVGGCRPKPRKLIAATRPIEYVMRRPISTISGLVTFGRSSPNTIRQRFSPTTSADLMKSRSTTSWPAPRMTRATRGAWVRPTVRTISHSFGPIAETASRTKMICRERQQDVVAAHQHVVEPVAASRPRRGRRRCRGTMPTMVAAADSHRTVRPPYSQRLKTSRPERVGAEQRVRGRAGVRRGDELGRRVRRDEPAEERDGDHERPRSRARCACA